MLFRYLYSSTDTNCFARMPAEKLIQALEISERLEINQVYKKCLSSLRRKKINPSNVINFFDYGWKKNLNEIMKKCIKVFENEGISVKHIKEDFSVTALLFLLSIGKIALSSEADLLSLAISWLSYPNNIRYKSHVLSLIDLYAISCSEYQDICKRYPRFFSDAELSSIILSKMRQDPNLLPKWYKPKYKSAVENNCSLCIDIHKKMNILKPLKFLKVMNRKDLKSVTQKFGFEFQQFPQVKLLSIDLNFGPDEIAPKEFVLQLSRNVPVKQYSVSTTKCNSRYKVILKSPLTLTSKDTLTLKFHFRRGLLANSIYVTKPITEEQQKIFDVAENDNYSIFLSSSEIVFYCSDSCKKFIVSSFHINACDNHSTFLSRKCIESGNTSIMMDLDPELENSPQTIPFKVDVKKEEIDIKMEVDDEKESYRKTEALKDVKPFIKVEEISLNSSSDDIQIVKCNTKANIEPELIDLTYEQRSFK